MSTLPHWIGSEQVTSPLTLPNVNPATGDVNSLISRGGADEVNMAVAKALNAVPTFSTFKTALISCCLLLVGWRREWMSLLWLRCRIQASPLVWPRG